MNTENTDNVTELLNYLQHDNIKAVDKSSLANFERVVYQDLKRIAFSRVRAEQNGASYTITALAHDAYVRLQQTNNMVWKNRRHFYGAVSNVMWRILVDRARYQQRKGRQCKDELLEFNDGLRSDSLYSGDVIKIDQLLKEIECNDQELLELVQLRYLMGLTVSEIAEMWECSTKTVERRWQFAKAWLYTSLKE